MDKKQLKAVVEAFDCPEEITINFLGGLSERSGTYKVIKVKTGRGKGGSKLITLEGSDGRSFVTGTTQSDSILNIVTKDGIMHGYESAIEVPKTYETNAGNAEKLKSQMRDFVGTEGARVFIADIAGEFDRNYTVTKAELKRGRYGQVVFTLQDDEGGITSLWSYRHSGIVTELKVLEVPTQETA